MAASILAFELNGDLSRFVSVSITFIQLSIRVDLHQVVMLFEIMFRLANCAFTST